MTEIPHKSLDHNFRDWEGHVFGFGYGTGEQYILPALRRLFVAIPERCYDYEAIEQELGPAVAWLFINAMCAADIFEYGTSPRYGWLSTRGEALKAYLATKSDDELYAVCCHEDETYDTCYPDACNCGPKGYVKGRRCPNPFWDLDSWRQ